MTSRPADRLRPAGLSLRGAALLAHLDAEYAHLLATQPSADESDDRVHEYWFEAHEAHCAAYNDAEERGLFVECADDNAPVSSELAQVVALAARLRPSPEVAASDLRSAVALRRAVSR